MKHLHFAAGTVLWIVSTSMAFAQTTNAGDLHTVKKTKVVQLYVGQPLPVQGKFKLVNRAKGILEYQCEILPHTNPNVSPLPIRELLNSTGTLAKKATSPFTIVYEPGVPALGVYTSSFHCVNFNKAEDFLKLKMSIRVVAEPVEPPEEEPPPEEPPPEEPPPPNNSGECNASGYDAYATQGAESCDDTMASSCPRARLLEGRQGFADSITGGLGKSVYHVTNLNDSGSGSLRAATGSGGRWIVFNVSGTLKLNEKLNIKSDITIDGRGRNIVITGAGMKPEQDRARNIIITGLTFKDGEGDAIEMREVDHVWIHRNTFNHYEDGLIDATYGATDITVSWNWFTNHDKVSLVGNYAANYEGDKNIRITYHHNWFNKTGRRHPKIEYGKMHAFNNYYDSWSGFGIMCGGGAHCYVERNIFDAGSQRTGVTHKDENVNEVPDPGYVRVEDNLVTGEARVESYEPGRVFATSEYYNLPYFAEAATDALRTKIKACSGRR